MKSVVQIQRQGKVKDVRASAAASGLPTEEIDSDGGADPGPDSAGTAGGRRGAGRRSDRVGRHTVLPDGRARRGVVRWGQQRGSVYLADQKLPVPVPRVRDRVANREISLTTYERLQRPAGGGCGLVQEGAGGPDLSAVRRLCGGGAGSVWAECLQRLPPLHPGQRPPPADLL